jgi:hypothetical protein
VRILSRASRSANVCTISLCSISAVSEITRPLDLWGEGTMFFR